MKATPALSPRPAGVGPTPYRRRAVAAALFYPKREQGDTGVDCLARFRRTAFVGGLVASTLLCGQPAAAQTEPRIKEILAAINKSYAAIAGQSASQAGEVCNRIVSTVMDMEALTRGASTSVWDGMSPPQRDAFRAAALRWVVRTCIQRNQDSSGDPLEFVGVRPGEGGDRLLATRSNKPVHFIVWRLRGAGKLRAVDLLLDGVSLTLTLRDEMKARLEQNDNDLDKATAFLGR